jgi:drug/metabolite transporter (DMT)-like permease
MLTNMLIAKATADEIPPFALAFWRWTGACLILLPFVGRRFWQHRTALKREWWMLLVLGALGMGVCGAIVYIGADTTTATNMGLIYSASPVFIVLIGSLFLRDRTTRIQSLGIGICLLGVVVVICRGDPSILFGLTFVVGDLWMLSAAVAWAAYSLLLRHHKSSFDTVTRFFAISLAGVIILAPFTLVEHLHYEQVNWSWAVIGWIAFTALVPAVAAYSIYAWIVDVLGPGRAGLILYLIPVYNSVLAWLLLGEKLFWFHYVGALLVVPGLWLATRNPKQIVPQQ